MAGIDRDYWLDFAKDGVSKSIESREKAADKLDTFLTWIWGIYTSVFALASLFNYVSSDIWQLIWVAQPVLIIMLSRYYCAIVSMPSSNNDDKIRADPNEVASIIDSFKLIVEDKKRKLQVAKILTLVSILSITVALVGYNFCDPNKELKQDIQKMKLKKDLNSQEIIPIKVQQSLNDSIKSLNDYYDYQIQNLIKKRKLKCVENNDSQCLDSLKLLEK
jgi:hypothetical protein